MKYRGKNNKQPFEKKLTWGHLGIHVKEWLLLSCSWMAKGGLVNCVLNCWIHPLIFSMLLNPIYNGLRWTHCYDPYS